MENDYWKAHHDCLGWSQHHNFKESAQCTDMLIPE